MLMLTSIILGLVIAEGFAQYCIQKSRQPNHGYYFIFAILAYTIVCGLLYYSFEHMPMSIINALWNALSVMFIVAIGAYFYNEGVLFGDLVGLTLIFFGTLLMFIYRRHHHNIIKT